MSISVVRLFCSMWLVTVPGPLTGFKLLSLKCSYRNLQKFYQKGEWTIWQDSKDYPSQCNVIVWICFGWFGVVNHWRNTSLELFCK